LWDVHVKIVDYEPTAIKSIQGFPSRGQFGSITYNSLSTFTQTHFLSHVFQAFPPQRCVVYPLGYTDLPFTNAEIPVLREFAQITLASSYALNLGYAGGYNMLTGATGFYYDLAMSAVANFSIPYVVRQIEENPSASPGRWSVFNL